MSSELKPKFEEVKSYYKKAYVLEHLGPFPEELISYQTKVAEVSNGKLVVFGYYSQTTARHVKEFALQHGFKVYPAHEMPVVYAPKQERKDAV